MKIWMAKTDDDQPAHHCTSNVTLRWVKDHDINYHPRNVGPKLAVTPKKQRGRLPTPKKYVLPTPQWVVRAKRDSVCVICNISYMTSVISGHFTRKENFNWIICRGCNSYMHYTCIKAQFRCPCGVAHLLGRKKMD